MPVTRTPRRASPAVAETPVAETTVAEPPVAEPAPAEAAVDDPAAAPAVVRRRAARPRPDGLPARTRRVASAGEPAPLDLARRIVELAEDKKAADIVILDVASLTTLADAFVICSGGSERQLEAIADGIVEGIRAIGIRPIGREGVSASHWVLIDFGAIVVHVFTPPERDFYQLEKHWAEAKTVLRVQ